MLPTPLDDFLEDSESIYYEKFNDTTVTLVIIFHKPTDKANTCVQFVYCPRKIFNIN